MLFEMNWKILFILCFFNFVTSDDEYDGTIALELGKRMLIEAAEAMGKITETGPSKSFASTRQDTRDIIRLLFEMDRSSISPPSSFVDCSKHLAKEDAKNGIFDISPNRCQQNLVKVYCDMKTEGGGWTVILRRKPNSEHIFDKSWTEYRNGFGNPKDDFWIGNQNLYFMTSFGDYSLRLEAEDDSGEFVWGQWDTFNIGSEDSKYRLTVSGFNPSSTALDLFKYHNQMSFSTKDADNDEWIKGSCASTWKGGWWYKQCSTIRPTGVHGRSGDDGILLSNWSKKNPEIRHAKELTLKIRPTVK